jgi:hypothetical protein
MASQKGAFHYRGDAVVDVDAGILCPHTKQLTVYPCRFCSELILANDLTPNPLTSTKIRGMPAYMVSKFGRADLRDDVRAVTATRKCRGDRRSAKRPTLCGLKQLMLLHHAEDELRCGDQGVLAKVGLG